MIVKFRKPPLGPSPHGSDGESIIVRLLLDAGAEVAGSDDNEFTALHVAALQGREGVVRILLDAGANVAAPAAMGIPPLLGAAQDGHEGVVRMLLDAGVDVAGGTGNGFRGGRASCWTWGRTSRREAPRGFLLCFRLRVLTTRGWSGAAGRGSGRGGLGTTWRHCLAPCVHAWSNPKP